MDRDSLRPVRGLNQKGNRNGQTAFVPKPSMAFSSGLYSLAVAPLIHWLKQRRVVPNTSAAVVFSILPSQQHAL